MNNVDIIPHIAPTPYKEVENYEATNQYIYEREAIQAEFRAKFREQAYKALCVHLDHLVVQFNTESGKIIPDYEVEDAKGYLQDMCNDLWGIHEAQGQALLQRYYGQEDSI